MRIAYFDCFSGISGDMLLGTLIDAGADIEKIELELKKLKLTDYKIRTKRVFKNQISATKFDVDVIENTHARHLSDINKIIEDSELDISVKELSKQIFKELAIVEAKIHNTSIDKIHFHEVGATDAIIDIIGSVIALKELKLDIIYSSKIHLGSGFVECQHGIIPVPAPATIELLKDIPVYSTGIKSELTTPTGAVIIKNIAKNFGIMPEMKIEKIGYGAGTKDLTIPNLLRVYIGEIREDKDNNEEYEKDNVILIETNIDDMNPEFFDYIYERLLENGSLDVFTTPIFMKKNRPSVMLSVLTTTENLDEILSIIFAETSTLGVRLNRLERRKLEREIITIKTKFGDMRIKISKSKGKIKNIAPEYEDCKKVASELKIPLKDVYDEVRRIAMYD